jgi:hypothetical protein
MLAFSSTWAGLYIYIDVLVETADEIPFPFRRLWSCAKYSRNRISVAALHRKSFIIPEPYLNQNRRFQMKMKISFSLEKGCGA